MTRTATAPVIDRTDTISATPMTFERIRRRYLRLNRQTGVQA